MRNNYTDRIARPYPEDSQLWLALDNIKGIRYEKMAGVRRVNDRRESLWNVPAKVWFDEHNWGAIIYQERYRVRPYGQQGMNKNQRRLLTERDEWLHVNRIPVLKIKRRWNTSEMRLLIENWISKTRKEIQ